MFLPNLFYKQSETYLSRRDKFRHFDTFNWCLDGCCALTYSLFSSIFSGGLTLIVSGHDSEVRTKSIFSTKKKKISKRFSSQNCNDKV